MTASKAEHGSCRHFRLIYSVLSTHDRSDSESDSNGL